MGSYILKRLVGAIAVLLGVSVLIFSIIRLAPGDSVAIMYGPLNLGGGGGNEMVPEEARECIREELGLNKPIVRQYFYWMGRVVRFDLGFSFRSRQPVTEELFRRLPATALLALFAFGIEVVLTLTEIRPKSYTNQLIPTRGLWSSVFRTIKGQLQMHYPVNLQG